MKYLCLLFFLLFFREIASEAPLVQLPNGLIRGRTAETKLGVNYSVFEQIPFAKPPIAELRFQAPVPPDSWEGVLDTVKYDKVCFAVSGDSDLQTEDCLYLNVYTPIVLGNNTAPEKTVMLYIYGGGFIQGDCQGCGPDFLINNDVVVVTINYRTGPFGFLSTQDEVVPGNNGLKDQQLAIKWTHENIALFGGDPEKITIFGQSAGSASVTYQLLNKNNQGLFRAAICESGVFLSPWAYQRDPKEKAFKLATILNSTFAESSDSEELLEFLLTVSDQDLKKASSSLEQELDQLDNKQIVQGFYWAPVVEIEHEEAFITQKMYGQLKSGNIIKIPILIGMTSEEAIYNARDIDSFTSDLQKLDENLAWLVPNDMGIFDENERTELGNKIREIYTKGEPFSEHIGSGVRYYSDNSFTRSVLKFSEFYSNFSTVYFYQFSYAGIMGEPGLQIILDGAESVGHAEELNYYWHGVRKGFDNADSDAFPPADITTQDRLLKILTDFAKYLDPTPEPSEILQNIQWPVFNAGSGDEFFYVNINESISIVQNPKSDTYFSWIALYDSLGDVDFDTY